MGRPIAHTGKKRIKVSTTIAPTTDQWLKDVWFKHGISKGDMFDRLVNRYGNELLSEDIETGKKRLKEAMCLMGTENSWPYKYF